MIPTDPLTVKPALRPSTNPIADVLRAGLLSHDNPDRNLEPGNVADGLYAVAHSIGGLAVSIERGLALLAEVLDANRDSE